MTTLAVIVAIGLLAMRPWQRPRVGAGWALPAVLAVVVTAGACGGGSGGSSPRPSTEARLEIKSPTPNAIMTPDFKLELNLIGATVVPESVTGGPLRGDQGHIHVTLDGKLISMTYGTSQDIKGLTAGPHNIQAEFVANDHAPFSNRVVVAVAFSVETPPVVPYP